MLLLTVYLSSNLNTASEPFKRQLCITSHAPSGWSSVGKSWSNACYMEARPPLAQSLKMNGINGVEQGALQTPMWLLLPVKFSRITRHSYLWKCFFGMIQYITHSFIVLVLPSFYYHRVLTMVTLYL